MKLFEIKIVASKRLGFCIKSITSFALGSSSFSRSDLDNEKNATSVPEIRADITNKTKSEIMPEAAYQSISNKIFVGSGSNELFLNSKFQQN